MCNFIVITATTQANSAHKDSQDQNKKEHVDKSQQKDKRNVTNKDKNSTAPDDMGKTVKYKTN
ncbi:putative leukocidin S subunit [Staphylococcus aureus]|nr:putative leukocidin S subunit [Staphylococcus aureus]